MPEMLKRIMGVVTALLLVGAPMAQGNPGSGDAHGTGRLTPIEFKILTDARVGMVKVALQLTPEQQQYWPAAGGCDPREVGGVLPSPVRVRGTAKPEAHPGPEDTATPRDGTGH
jgi:hypothetical protein